MNDDLDSLLGDVDSVNEFQGALAEEKRIHEQEMRKGDRVVVDTEDMDTEKKFRSRVASAASNPDLLPFHHGYIKAIGTHNEIIAQFRDLTSDKAVTDTMVSVMKKYRYTFSRNVENIEKTFSEFLTSYSPDMIMKKNRQDFYLFFSTEEMNQNRLDFLLIKELFLRLREYNGRFRKDWEELNRGIGVINLVADGKSTYALCSEIINGALAFCEKTDLYVQFLSLVLGMQEGSYDVLEKDIGNKIVYFESFPYAIDGIFLRSLAPEREKISDDMLSLDKVSPDAGPAKAVAPEEPRSRPAHTFSRVEPSYNPNFTVRGSCAWNKIEPYIIKIDGAKLSKENADLDSSVYFNAELPDPVKVNGLVKRAMLRFMKDSSVNIKPLYSEFIFKTISVQIHDVADYLAIPEERVSLFTYHLGPLTVARLLLDIFTETQVGVCYKMLADNRVSRFIPSEFIRDRSLVWFENNINQLELPFDRVSEYSELKRLVQDKYVREKDHSLQKIDQAVEQYYRKTGKRLDRDALLKNKMNELFGTRMISVYNRFIDRTIFK